MIFLKYLILLIIIINNKKDMMNKIRVKKSYIRQSISNLIEHGNITTTLYRCKILKPIYEKMITRLISY